MHHYFQYSTFTLAPQALKLIVKCTASTLRLALTLARLALMPINKYTVITLKLTLKPVHLVLKLIKCTLKLVQKIQMHSIHTDTTEVSHAHMANFTQQLSYLFIPHQLNKKPHTPIRLYTLQVEFTIHPDWTFVDQLIHDLQHGCDIGYIGPQFLHYSNNLPSSFQHPSTLDNNITTEYNTGRILGPFGTPPLHNFWCSGLGLVPKHNSGWWAIYHFSTPYGSNINDSIDPDTFTLSYCSIDETFAIVSALGKDTLMLKIDFKNAFFLIPVPPEPSWLPMEKPNLHQYLPAIRP